jgi:signal transduction histidine kinase/ActR/RegA family two-component response regulator
LLVLVSTVPLAAAAIGWIYYVYADKQQQFEGSLKETTRALALVVDREIARRDAMVRTLAASPALQTGELQRFYDFARTIAPDPSTVVVLATLDGRQILNTRRPFGQADLPRTVYTYEEVRRAPRQTLLSDIYFAPLGQAYSFAVTVPVERDGKAVYLVSYAGYASAMQKVFDDQQLQASWVASVVDSKGTVVARNRDPERFVGKSATGPLSEALRTGPSGLLHTRSLDGTPVLTAFSRAPGHGWSVVVGVPITQVGSAAAVAGRYGIVAALLLLVALWLATRIGRSLVRPVLMAESVAERIARAEPVEAQATGLAEMDKVLRVLADTSLAVHSANDEMQSRVREALSEADRAHQVVLQNQRLEALGQLTGGVAHDFNNLLMVISNYSHLIKARNPQLAGTPELAGIERAVGTGTKLTRQLLAFARRQPVRPEALRLQDRLPEIAGLLKASLGSGIRLECQVAPDTACVLVDPAEFELALINLSVNARDAMPNGGRLQVSASNDEDGMVRIEVADTGEGIAADVLPKIFDPFFTTKPVGHGTGLGLSQVYGLVRQAGGDARVQSQPGLGTTVALLLPAHHAGTPVPLDGAAPPPERVPGGVHVLLVEDNAELATVTVEVLRTAGYEVTHALSGDKAKGLLREGGRYRIVLSDIRMPGDTDGIALARWIRTHQPATPVVLMTGYSAELAQAEALALQVLPKPSAPAEILAALARELRGSRPEPEALRA